MKRLLWITLCACMTFCALAQKQQGIVRTIERPGQKSVGINGVTIKINEYPNAIVSGKGGKFSFAIQGKKQGDRCLITRVEKKGYTQIDKLPSFAYSFSTPVEIVLVSNKQLQQDEKRIRDKASEKAEANYNKRIAELERQLQEKTISEEKYREQLQHVFDGYENYIKMIDDMARRYAMTDYKGISDINRKIQECIENAEFERADSLINSKGDIQQRKQKLDEKRDVKQKIDSFSIALQEEINFGTNELASDFFTKHLICAERYDNDSAAYWLEQRAKLDTTNVEWLSVAGKFIQDYLADYSLAMKYFQRGLRQSISNFGEQSEWTAIIYNNLGVLYTRQGYYSQAMEYIQKSLTIREHIFGKESLDLANSYNNIGLLYSNQGKYHLALEYYQKGLSIKKRLLGDNHQDLAIFYNNLGSVYDTKGDYSLALEYYKMALAIGERALASNKPELAVSYNNIGVLYTELGDFSKSLQYYQKALSINECVFGLNHPNVAMSYSNLGSLYSKLGDYTQALDYYQKALSIREHVLEPDHLDIADSYFNIGTLHAKKDNLPLALDYYHKALSIQERSLGTDNSSIAITYNGLGVLYEKQGNFFQALEYYLKALPVLERSLGTDNSTVADCYNNLGSLYYRQNDFASAKNYFEKSLYIKEKIYDAENVDLALSYNNIGTIYDVQGDYSRALDYYQKALSINERFYGTNHADVATSYNNIGTLYYHQGNNTRALEYYKKSLEIREHLLNTDESKLAESYNNIGHVYSSMSDFSTALPYYEKSWSISEKRLGVDSPKTKLDRWDYYSCLYNKALQSGSVGDFLLEHCFIATVAKGETPAKQQGMSGEYILLEHTEWNENSDFSFIEYIRSIGNKPKDLVVLQNGAITKHHFENKIGVSFEIKQITKEERKQINQLYEKWKKEQNN